jgi:hypothetical protein
MFVKQRGTPELHRYEYYRRWRTPGRRCRLHQHAPRAAVRHGRRGLGDGIADRTAGVIVVAGHVGEGPGIGGIGPPARWAACCTAFHTLLDSIGTSLPAWGPLPGNK